MNNVEIHTSCTCAPHRNSGDFYCLVVKRYHDSLLRSYSWFESMRGSNEGSKITSVKTCIANKMLLVAWLTSNQFVRVQLPVFAPSGCGVVKWPNDHFVNYVCLFDSSGSAFAKSFDFCKS